VSGARAGVNGDERRATSGGYEDGGEKKRLTMILEICGLGTGLDWLVQ